jgi:hypothetical protein
MSSKMSNKYKEDNNRIHLVFPYYLFKVRHGEPNTDKWVLYNDW